MWENWKDLFLEVLDKHALLQQKKIRSHKIPWITSEIKSLINTRDKLKIKAASKTETDWVNYKVARNQVNIKLRNAKQIIIPQKLLVKSVIKRRLGKQSIISWQKKTNKQ